MINDCEVKTTRNVFIFVPSFTQKMPVNIHSKKTSFDERYEKADSWNETDLYTGKYLWCVIRL